MRIKVGNTPALCLPPLYHMSLLSYLRIVMLRRFSLLLILILLLGLDLGAQDMKAYQIYSAKAKKVSFGKMAKKLSKADLVLFGESHDLSLAHWLELLVLEHLAAQPQDLVLGLEMFEADEQDALDRYQAGMIDHDSLAARITLWSNYETDYRSVVDRAVELGVHVVATNAPTELPRKVFREGFSALEGLAPETIALLPELPIPYDPTLPGYKKMLEMDHGDMNSENFPRAQAIRDATMAHHIIRHLGNNKVLHLNGSYHSDHFEGICWYVNHHRPETALVTISTVTQKDISQLESAHAGKADFIICVPEQMPRSYHTSF